MTTTMTDLASGKTYVLNEALPGRDAYEVALAQGFTGTRAEWIASLRGLEFDPDNALWENDRAYLPRAAVIHDNSFWFARVANQGVEPGSDGAVWVKLVHGEDAATLANAISTLESIRDAAHDIANADADMALPGGGFSANHHRVKALIERQQAEAAAQTAEEFRDLTVAAAQALTPICALHDLDHPVPSGWWDTLDRLPAVASLLSTTSSYAIICNWQPASLVAGRDGSVWDVSQAGTGVGLGAAVQTVADLSANANAATQPSVALRPRLGIGPVTGVRNRLTADTTNLTDGTGWGAFRMTRVAAPDNATGQPATLMTATQDSPNGSGFQQPSASVLEGEWTWSAVVKGSGWIALRCSDDADFADAAVAWFDLSTGVAGSASLASGAARFSHPSSTITPAGDGHRVSLTFTVSDPVPVSVRIYLVDGNGDLDVSTGASARVEAPQLEPGGALTAYQASRTVNLDVTEAGIPSAPYLRFNLSDDRLETSFAEAGTYDVLVAGRGGSWIERDVALGPGADLWVGARRFAGGVDGSLAAIGGGRGEWADIVGVTVLDRTITEDELARLIRYYRARGAKGLLVPGPELIANNSFDADISGWTDASSAGGGIGWNAAGHLDLVANTGTSRANVAVGMTGGTAYQLSVTVADAGGTASAALFTDDNDNLVSLIENGTATRLIVSMRDNANLSARNFTTGTTVSLDAISLREMRPEEDW